MKKSILIIVSIMSTLVWAGAIKVQSEIPQIVTRTFKHHFPGAKDVAWEKDMNFFKASYAESGKHLFVYLDTQGNIVEIDRQIQVNELPQEYTKRIQKFIADDFKPVEVLVADDFSTNPYYIIKLQKGNRVYELNFSDVSPKHLIHEQRQGVYVW